MSDVDDELHHQGMAIELIDAFIEHDMAGLASLDATGRAAQIQHRSSVTSVPGHYAIASRQHRLVTPAVARP